jgi:DNA invertase Pin-like site-specific DNA recombinase
MAVYGYARVSSADQDYSLQENALRAAGCEVIRAEKVSGQGPRMKLRGSGSRLKTVG